MTEFNVELVELYAETFDLKTEDLMQGKTKKTKKTIGVVNDLARKVISCSKDVTKAIYKVEEASKFDYLQVVLNMELQCASKYAKLVESDPNIAISNLQKSIESYSAARKFINDFKTFKKFGSDAELSEDLRTQANICDEMI